MAAHLRTFNIDEGLALESHLEVNIKPNKIATPRIR